MATTKQYYCEKCKKTLNEANFYTKRNGEKPSMCKNCITMHIDNYDPTTFEWILELLDVPYIPDEWERIRAKENERTGGKLTGLTVIGKYLSFLKLKQYRNAGYADSARLIAEKQAKVEALKKENHIEDRNPDDLRQQLAEGLITEAQFKTLLPNQVQQEEIMNNPIYRAALAATGQNVYGVPHEQQEYIEEEELPDLGAELTKEDKLYLAMKWGRLYTPAEWVELEKLYSEYEGSFDITDTDTRNNIFLICKTFHKMNKALDENDIDTYNKLNRTYESLRKTAKLTAAQNKGEKENFVDALGNVVDMCEKKGFIPNFCSPDDSPQDKIDFAIKDMKNFYKTLAEQNLNLSQQLETYLQRIQIQDEMEEDEGRSEEEKKKVSQDELKEFFEDTFMEEDILSPVDLISEDDEIEKPTIGKRSHKSKGDV